MADVAVLSAQEFSFDERRVANWSTTREKQISTGHPFTLLSPRNTTNKYHTELPQILADGGGAGEMEETMMWYSVAHQKAQDDLVLPEDTDGPWVDAKWKDEYLERVEKRQWVFSLFISSISKDAVNLQGCRFKSCF